VAGGELDSAGLTVHVDRWNLEAGRRLWEQIGAAISDPSRTDAWMIYATINSLASEPCKEELYYAVTRALDARGGHFPVLALFPSGADLGLLPPALKIRLNVSLEDNDWIERVIAGVEGRDPVIARPELGPYAINLYRSSSRHFIKIRPRAGTVSRFFVAVPSDEKDALDPSVHPALSGEIPTTSIVDTPRSFDQECEGVVWWVMTARNQATPAVSYFLQCKEIPSRLLFGQFGGQVYVWPKAD
jgi:hypothetical protein